MFKIASGVNNGNNQFVWDVYKSSATANEDVTAALDVTNQYQDHYKNRVILNWDTFNPTQVRKEEYRCSLQKGTRASLWAKTGIQSRLVREKTIGSLSKRRF